MVTMDYNQLKPGYYIHANGGTKSLSMSALEEALGANGGAPETAQELSATVSWVYIALSRRRSMALEVPSAWRVNGKDAEGKIYGWSSAELLSRVDNAIQKYGVAYLFKARGRGTGAVKNLQWLDPATIAPVAGSERPGGYLRYERRLGADTKVLSDDDLIVIRGDGTSEAAPETAAVNAVWLPAQLLDAMQRTQNSVFDNNAIPPSIIVIPEGTAKTERDKLKDLFSRVLNPGRRSTFAGNGPENRVVPISGGDGVKVIPLALAPRDMMAAQPYSAAMDAILAAMAVPRSIALSDAANYATANSAVLGFLRTMTAACENYAADINDDPDLQKAGASIIVYPDRHELNRALMLERAQAVGALISAGFTREAAAFLAGITPDDFPSGLDIWQDNAQDSNTNEPVIAPAPTIPTIPADTVSADDMPGAGKALAELRQWEAKTAKGKPLAQWQELQIPADIAAAVKSGGMTFEQARLAITAEAAIRAMELERRISALETGGAG